MALSKHWQAHTGKWFSIFMEGKGAALEPVQLSQEISMGGSGGYRLKGAPSRAGKLQAAGEQESSGPTERQIASGWVVMSRVKEHRYLFLGCSEEGWSKKGKWDECRDLVLRPRRMQWLSTNVIRMLYLGKHETESSRN